MFTAAWRVHYVPHEGEVYIFIGQWMIGTITLSKGDPNHAKPHYVAHINLPGCVGPVSRDREIQTVKIETTAKVREWMEQLTATPAPIPPRKAVGYSTQRSVPSVEPSASPAPMRLRRSPPSGMPSTPLARVTRTRPATQTEDPPRLRRTRPA